MASPAVNSAEMWRLMRPWVVALAAAIAWGMAFPAGAATSYVARNLGTLGGTSSGAYGINNHGEITGWSHIAGDRATRAFLYSAGTISDLGTLGGTSSVGYAINDSGQVAGVARTAGDAASHAFLYSRGRMSDLGTLGGTNSAGRAINSGGQVTGGSDVVGGKASHAFLYANGAMTDLGTLEEAPGFGTSSMGTSINSGGQVTGWSVIMGPAPRYRAFLYADGGMRDLGTLAGANSWGANSWGYAINAQGDVTGTSDTGELGEYAGHVFRYASGVMTDLGTLGGDYAESFAINSLGQVTGWSYLADNRTRHAFVVSAGAMYDLNMLVVFGLAGATLYEASGINEMGQVIANGCVGDPGSGSCSAFLLDPISSPLAAEVIPALSETMLAVVVLLVLATGIAALQRSQIASRT